MPMYIAWGKEFTHNFTMMLTDPFWEINILKPWGVSTNTTWHEIWPTIGPIFTEVMEGKSVSFDIMLFLLKRSGCLEEAYLNFSYSPIPCEDGTVGGILATCTETTETVNREKLLKTEREKFYSTLMQASAARAF